MASAHPMQDRECFRRTLEKWLELNVGVTWANLELAITNAYRGNLGLQPLTTGKENVFVCACVCVRVCVYVHACMRVHACIHVCVCNFIIRLDTCIITLQS